MSRSRTRFDDPPSTPGMQATQKKFERSGKISAPFVLPDMTNFDHDGLPQDLTELGRRLRDERPVADDDALDRMMRRAHVPSRRSPRHARRAFAVSLATMFAMVSVTGVAAAALFGMSFGSIGKAFTGSTTQVGKASNQVLRAPAPSTNANRPASSIGSALGGLGSLGGSRPPARPAAPAAVAAGPSASLLPGLGNAGNAQYGARRLVCRILRALGLRFVARLLGC
jgi:hypothetical protein